MVGISHGALSLFFHLCCVCMSLLPCVVTETRASGKLDKSFTIGLHSNCPLPATQIHLRMSKLYSGWDIPLVYPVGQREG